MIPAALDQFVDQRPEVWDVSVQERGVPARLAASARSWSVSESGRTAQSLSFLMSSTMRRTSALPSSSP